MAHTEKRTQLYLSAEQHAAVQRLARQRGLSMAAVVREAIQALVESTLARQPADGADPLADLIGVFEGPGDLAERHDDYLYGPAAWGGGRGRRARRAR